MKKLLQILTVMTVTGCGVDIVTPEDQQMFNQKSIEEEDQNKESLMVETNEPIYLQGSVSSGFSITVNGQSYLDSEDFYTQQLDALEAEKAEKYPGYELMFDADLGLNDLKNGMTIYAEGIGDTGYAGETIVVNDGTFEIKFPSKAEGETINVRANKRIGITLEGRDGDLIYWCYNFSAILETTISAKNKPIILRHFDTRLTKYKCTGRRSNPLSIPMNESSVSVNQVDDGKAPTQAQLDEWDREWEEEVVGNKED
jgi:hypothetical protein